MRLKLFLILYIAVSLQSCEKLVMQQENKNNPVDVFECMWNEYDRLYALFEVKKINWDSIYSVYRPMVISSTGDDGLYNILTSMLSNLNDNHVYLFSPGREEYRAGSLYHRPVFPDSKYEDYNNDKENLLNLIKEKYLNNQFVITSTYAVLFYGTIDNAYTGNKNIGYLYIENEDYGDMDFISQAKEYFIQQNSDAVIVDVRINPGGEDAVSKHIADQFADTKRLFMKTQTRNGVNHNDFDSPMEWYIEPDDDPFLNPVVLLTSRHSASASENLTLAMRIIPHVTILGDTTSGCFSNTLPRELPNGWQYTIAFQLFTAANDTCYEGIGIPPDIVMNNYRVDINNRVDKVLEKAIELLK